MLSNDTSFVTVLDMALIYKEVYHHSLGDIR